jgi:biotin synthase-like enzyme
MEAVMENQGRGARLDERRVEKAAKRAKENGGGDYDIKRAAREEFNSEADEIIRAIQEKIRRVY